MAHFATLHHCCRVVAPGDVVARRKARRLRACGERHGGRQVDRDGWVGLGLDEGQGLPVHCDCRLPLHMRCTAFVRYVDKKVVIVDCGEVKGKAT